MGLRRAPAGGKVPHHTRPPGIFFRSFFFGGGWGGGSGHAVSLPKNNVEKILNFFAAFSIMGRGSMMQRLADPHFYSISPVPATLKVFSFYSGSRIQASGSWMSLVHTPRTPRP